MKISFNSISASDKSDTPKQMAEIVEDKIDVLADDFDFAVAGIEKLCRDGSCEQASLIVDKISAVVNEAIAEIGDNFESEI